MKTIFTPEIAAQCSQFCSRNLKRKTSYGIYLTEGVMWLLKKIRISDLIFEIAILSERYRQNQSGLRAVYNGGLENAKAQLTFFGTDDKLLKQCIYEDPILAISDSDYPLELWLIYEASLNRYVLMLPSESQN